MKKQIQIDPKKQIELAADQLAQILIQQIISKKNNQAVKQKAKIYGKQN